MILKKISFVPLLLILSLSYACKKQPTSTSSHINTTQPHNHNEDNLHCHNNHTHNLTNNCSNALADEDTHEHHHNDNDEDCGTIAGYSKKKLPNPIQPGETLTFGAPLTIQDQALSLSDAIKQIDDNKNKTIAITGEVERVCAAMGCWMTFKNTSAEPIRIVMKKHSFFIPKNSKGAHAVAQGILEKKIVPKELLEHYAKETNEKIDIPNHDTLQYVFTADGVTLSMPKT